MSPRHFLIGASLAILTVPSALAALRMPQVFSDHMVLQRDQAVAIWGTADPGSKVSVRFAGQTRDALADAGTGRWKVELAPLETQAAGSDLTVTNGSDSLVLRDVLVGEVWFASGQSNMQVTVTNSENARAATAAANFPQIRMFQGSLTPASTPQDDVPGKWQIATPETVGSFSAVGWYFALKLHRELGVPVGIVRSCWGGKPVQTFTSREALASIPEGKALLDAHDLRVSQFDGEAAKNQQARAMENYRTQLEAWKSKPAASRGGKPREPTRFRNPASLEGQPTTLYNGMIHPYVGFTMRGAIWYQGEANAKNIASARAYGKLFPLMIQDWRKRWGSDFSFLWVQLANFKEASTEPGASDPWALLQDMQRRSLVLPKTGMAVINDIGDAKDIHPKNKKDVGERLARWALAHDYGKDVIACGPLYQSSRIEDGKIRITFQHAGKGLKTRDGKPVRRMEISGKDGTWHWADTTLDGDSLLVSSPEVPEPAAARYAWASNPADANLVNSDDLPASIFTTLENPE
jgi:sialate O-acetylesterase